MVKLGANTEAIFITGNEESLRLATVACGIVMAFSIYNRSHTL